MAWTSRPKSITNFLFFIYFGALSTLLVFELVFAFDFSPRSRILFVEACTYFVTVCVALSIG